MTGQATPAETSPSNVDQLVERARATYIRVRAHEAAAFGADGGLLVQPRSALSSVRYQGHS